METQIKSILPIIFLCLFLQPVFSQDKLYPNEKYVIVLDVQQYWTDNALGKGASAEMLSSINRLIEKTDPKKVIYIKTNAGTNTVSISWKGFRVDTISDYRFDSRLSIVNDQAFVKTSGDAFTVDEMTSIFETNKAKEIIIVGLMAEQCVYKTVLGGLARNYDIFLVPEAIGAKSAKSKERRFKKLVKNGAKIIGINQL